MLRKKANNVKNNITTPQATSEKGYLETDKTCNVDRLPDRKEEEEARERERE